MKKQIKMGRSTGLSLISLTLTCIVILALAGCKGVVDTPTTTTNPGTTSTQTQTAADGTGFDFTYTDRDKDASYDESSAVVVDLANPSSTTATGVVSTPEAITLTEEGTYIVRGSASELSLVVDAPDDVKVQIVLDGVNITNKTAPALLIKDVDKVFVTLAPGSTNSLSDGSGRTDLPATEEEEAALEAGGESVENATLFSHSDLTINGTGKLSVSSKSAHAIKSSDDLVITGGDLTIDAAVDGLRGKDCVKIADGTIVITAGDDAITSTNTNEPDSRGFVSIDGGTIRIEAVDDAVHAETILRVAGGTVNVTSCEEGFEGAQVWIQGGDHSIVSNDDGVNAAGDARTDYLVDISGGTLSVNAEGDGIDSNGSIIQSGGDVIVDGPARSGNSALDAQQGATTSGGTMLALGESGMAQSFGTGSTQFAFIVALPQTLPANTVITLIDSQGTEHFTHTSAKQFSSLVYSSPTLLMRLDYTIIADGEELMTFHIEETQAQVASDGTVSPYTGEGMGGPGGIGSPGGAFGGAPRGDGGEPSEGGGFGGPRGERSEGAPPEGTPRGAPPA
jgi:hypothetical protein